MSRLKHPLFWGILVAAAAILLFLSPLGRSLEKDISLSLLFALRGPNQPPSKAVIINIDHESSNKLGLPQNFSTWPRTAHAELINKLNDYGAAVIVFDIHFADRKQPADDQVFSESIQRAGNVILFEKLTRQTFGPNSINTSRGSFELESQVPPVKLVADAALAVAPFPIPKIPIRINQAWTFKTAAGDTPTLPVVALQALTLDRYDQFYHCLQVVAPDKLTDIPPSAEQVISQFGLVETMRRLRVIFQDSSLVSRFFQIVEAPSSPFSIEDRHVLKSLAHTYSRANNIYINYYGPPASLTTYSFHQIISTNLEDKEQLREMIKDSVVFIGAARTTWSEQKDGFYTVYSQPDGLDLSGVELLATVFLNLFEDKPLKPLPGGTGALLILMTAAVVCMVSFALSPVPALAVLAIFIVSVLYGAYFLFSQYGIWIPVFTSLVVLPILSFLAAMLHKYILTRNEQKHIKKALKLYLPDSVVEEISRDLSFVETGDRMVYGVCLLSDAKNYTTLSEKMEPTDLSLMMKHYFGCLFKQVNENDGVVCNVIGDTMFALWPSTEPQSALKTSAIRAALQIPDAIDQFNHNYPKPGLPTRVGLHAGYLLMGNIGAEGHFEYAPVGDIVNTASRIEGLNKLLGTWVLASEETVEQSSDLNSRLMGTFLLKGKSNPVTIYQLLPGSEITPGVRRVRSELFPEALELFQKQMWQEACEILHHCLELQADDGPSRFYLQLCTSYLKKPPAAKWEGIIPVGS